MLTPITLALLAGAAVGVLLAWRHARTGAPAHGEVWTVTLAVTPAARRAVDEGAPSDLDPRRSLIDVLLATEAEWRLAAAPVCTTASRPRRNLDAIVLRARQRATDAAAAEAARHVAARAAGPFRTPEETAAAPRLSVATLVWLRGIPIHGIGDGVTDAKSALAPLAGLGAIELLGLTIVWADVEAAEVLDAYPELRPLERPTASDVDANAPTTHDAPVRAPHHDAPSRATSVGRRIPGAVVAGLCLMLVGAVLVGVVVARDPVVFDEDADSPSGSWSPGPSPRSLPEWHPSRFPHYDTGDPREVFSLAAVVFIAGLATTALGVAAGIRAEWRAAAHFARADDDERIPSKRRKRRKHRKHGKH